MLTRFLTILVACIVSTGCVVSLGSGGAVIIDKYGAKPEFPIALRSTATEFEEVRIKNVSAIQNAKTGQRRSAV